jgi:alcohol dehydrogenase class IV
VNAVMLPHVVAYNAAGAPEAIARVASAVGVDDAAGGLFDLAVGAGAPASLVGLGMPADGLDQAAQRAVSETTFNPVPVDVPAVRAMLDDAWHGRRPSVAAG